MGWRTAGPGGLQKMRYKPLLLRARKTQALQRLPKSALQMPQGTLQKMPPAPMHMQKGENHTGRRQRAHHPAHDGYQLLAS